MRAVLSSVVIAVGVLVAGCQFMQNFNPQERLRDNVNGLNEEGRWGRQDLASERVTAEFRPRFLASRHAWGRTIQVADVEITDMQMNTTDSGATSVVVVGWYRTSEMTLTQTTVRQRWARVGRNFLLEAEDVVDGDPGLIVVPSSGGDSESTGDDSTVTTEQS